MAARVVLSLAASLMLLAVGVAPVVAQPATTDWPMYQFDLKHTGKSTAAGPGAGTQGVQTKWTYHSVSWVKDQVAIGPKLPPSGAGIPGQAVFFGDGKFPLCMVDPNRNTGDPATWCTDIGGFVNASSPAIGNPVGGVQTVYIGDRNNIFWAIDSRTHQPLWHWKIPLDGDVHGSPIINPVTGTVYVSCGCTTTGVLYAWDKSPNNIDADGVAVPRWTVYIPPSIRNSQPVGVFRNGVFRIYIGTADGRLAAIDDNGATGGIPVPGKPGKPNWSLKLKFGNEMAAKNYHSSPTIGPDGTIYIGTDKGIYAVTDNGAGGEVLSLFTGGITGEWDTAFSIDTVNGKTLLYASVYSAKFRTFYAIDVTNPLQPQTFFKYGPFRGTTSTGFAVTPAPVLDANGIVYAAIGPTILAFDPRNAAPGTPRWSFDLTNGGDAISLAVGERVLYVAAKDFTLYALEASGPSSGLTPTRADFNGDGKADILWRHSSGLVCIWLMNGASSIGQGCPGTVGLDWTIQNVGDFNGDGKADILWRHSSGAVCVWFMDGPNLVSSGCPGGAGLDWTIEGVGDFNGDGKADILWRHSSGAVCVWFMDGSNLVSSGCPGGAGLDWSIQDIGDFNGDRNSDILWRHTSGSVCIWFMNGASLASSGCPGAAGLDWTIEGAGDFNGDGKSDILWRHSSGVASLWLLDGASIIGSGSPGGAGTDWTVQGIGDFNSDGKGDILWRHSSGTVCVWFMNGLTLSSAGCPGGAGNDWQIQ